MLVFYTVYYFVNYFTKDNRFQVLSGNSVLKDGVSIIEIYGVDLDKAIEGDHIGVMRTGQVGLC